MEKIIQQSLFGPEMDIVLNDEKTDKIIKKLKKKPKEVGELPLDKFLKSKNISFSDKLGRVKAEVERILGGYNENTVCIYDRNEFHDYISAAIKNGIIAIDTETLGTRDDIEKPATDSFTCRLAGLCIYTPGQKNAYIPINHVDYETGERFENQLTEEDVYEELKRVVDAKTINLFQNGKFDYMVLYYTCGIKVPITWDTMIGSQILDENELAGLKFQYRDKINPEQEKYDIDKLFDLDNLDKYPPELFALYAATDAFMTYELYKYQKKEFEKRGNEKLYSLFLDIEMPVVTVTSEMQMRGVGIDKEFAQRLSDKYHKKLEPVEEGIARELESYKDIINEWKLTPEANNHPIAPNGKKQKSMVEQLSDPIDVNSSKQLGILLYHILKVLKPKVEEHKFERTKVKESVDEDTLLTIKDKLPLIPLILKKREYDKYLTRSAASRQAANASGRMESSVSPAASLSFRSAVVPRSSPSLIAEYLSARASILSTIGLIFLICLSLYVPNNLSASDIFSILSKFGIPVRRTVSLTNIWPYAMYYTVFFIKIPHDFVNKIIFIRYFRRGHPPEARPDARRRFSDPQIPFAAGSRKRQSPRCWKGSGFAYPKAWGSSRCGQNAPTSAPREVLWSPCRKRDRSRRFRRFSLPYTACSPSWYRTKGYRCRAFP